MKAGPPPIGGGKWRLGGAGDRGIAMRVITGEWGRGARAEAGADPAPGRGGLVPMLSLLGAWSPSYKFAPVQA